MNYEEAKQYLHSAMHFGSQLGLDRMNALMKELGHPGEEIPCIHVAGTNGKGSTSVMSANILASAGYKVGLYTSPFIQRFSERIRIIDKREGLMKSVEKASSGEITDDSLAECVTEVREKTEPLVKNGMEHPTEFELVTAAAFLWFEKEKCDYIVLETGLGGRLDSTNIVQAPIKCIITAIGYDHMDRLGNTIGEIATEKAGIIKPNAEVFVYNPFDYTNRYEAGIIKDVIEKACLERGVKSLQYIKRKNITVESSDLSGQTFSYSTEEFNIIRIFTSLLGGYQPMNGALAAHACLNIAGVQHVLFGIRQSRWPARLEVIRKDQPCILLDGAHNEQGASALRDSIAQLFPDKEIVILCGVMKDKDYRKMLTIVLSSDQYKVKAVFCTRPQNDRALGSFVLATVTEDILDKLPQNVYNRNAKIFYDEEVVSATDRAILTAYNTGSVMIAFGSLYMAGTVREHVMKMLNNKAKS